jgi:hypothetical protein
VGVAQVQQAARRVFSRWGCPEKIRVDNGIPWAIPAGGGLPSELSLWLAGLGIWMHWNDAYKPEQNGVVESTQGTSQRWIEPANCANVLALCQRAQQEDENQRERYPAINGMSRRAAYPGLLHSGRGYCRGWEELVWDGKEALRFLARFRVRRKVSKRGQVSLYHRLIQVSAEQGGSWVYVQMEPESAHWVIYDAQGEELRRRPAEPFSAEALMNLGQPAKP